MDRRLPGLFAVAVALLLLANPFYLLPHAGEPAYSHSIERVDASEIPDEADVLNYSDLSPEAQHAIDEALQSEDGHALVHGEANKPPEFFYSDHSSLGQGLYYVQQDGTYYELYTYASGGLFPVESWLQWLLLMYGTALLVLGGWSVRDRRTRTPTAFGAVGAVFVLILATGTEPYGGLGLVLAALIALLALVVATAQVARNRDSGETGATPD